MPWSPHLVVFYIVKFTPLYTQNRQTTTARRQSNFWTRWQTLFENSRVWVRRRRSQRLISSFPGALRLAHTLSVSTSRFDNEKSSVWLRKDVCCSFFKASSFPARISCSRRTRSSWSAASSFSFCSNRVASAALSLRVCSVLWSLFCNASFSERRSEFERCSRSRAAFFSLMASSRAAIVALADASEASVALRSFRSCPLSVSYLKTCESAFCS